MTYFVGFAPPLFGMCILHPAELASTKKVSVSNAVPQLNLKSQPPIIIAFHS